MIVRFGYRFRFTAVVSIFVTVFILVVITENVEDVPQLPDFDRVIETGSIINVDEVYGGHERAPTEADLDSNDVNHYHAPNEQNQNSHPHANSDYTHNNLYDEFLEVSGNDYQYITPNQTDSEPETEPEEKEEDDFDFREDDEQYLRPHYALDHRKAVRLALVERKISSTLMVLSLFGTDMDAKCSLQVQRYLDDYDLDTKALNGMTSFKRATNVSAHPLLLFRMIRRMVVTLGVDVKEACTSDILEEVDEALQSSIASANITLPTNQDLEDATLGIIRIHYVYGYNATSQLRFGIFGDVHTNVTLNFEDCILLANRAVEMEARVLAYQWLLSANLSLAEQKQGRQLSSKKSSKLEAAWNGLFNYFNLTKLKIPQLLQVLGRSQQLAMAPHFHDYKEYAACRGEEAMSDSERAKLHCFFNYMGHPYWLINPLKVELLHLDPPVWQFYDFVGDKMIEYLKNKSVPFLKRSGVVNVEKRRTEFSPYRTSLTAWYYDYDNFEDMVSFNFNRKIEFATGLEVNKRGASQALQVVSYSALGGHYDFHEDSLGSEIALTTDGDRVSTFLLFLSDVKMGGYTAFTKLGVAARPQKGSAIYWFSSFLNGKPDRRSTHGGCPVILGSKLAANKWIMYNQNFLKYSCSLNPEK